MPFFILTPVIEPLAISTAPVIASDTSDVRCVKSITFAKMLSPDIDARAILEIPKVDISSS